jgi:hypothetical protein
MYRQHLSLLDREAVADTRPALRWVSGWVTVGEGKSDDNLYKV